MATTTQNQDEGSSRSMQGAATSQDTNQGGQETNQGRRETNPGGAMQRAATSPGWLGPLIPFSQLSPFSLMRRIFADFERMLDPLIAGDIDVDRGRGLLDIEWIPRMDVAQRDDALVVRVDLPGISPEQVSIFLSGNELVIEGERSEEERSAAPWHSERIYGRFRRVIGLPVDVDTDAVAARFENGVLEVSLPVQGGERRRRIEIQTGGGESRQQVQGQEGAQKQGEAPVQGEAGGMQEGAQVQGAAQGEMREEELEREMERERLGSPQAEARSGEGARP